VFCVSKDRPLQFKITITVKICGPLRTSVLRVTTVGFAFCTTTAHPLALAQNDAAAQQKRAIQQIEDCRQKFYKNDALPQMLVPELDRIAEELSGTVEQFTRAGDDAAAALSLIKLGEIQRMENHHAEALEFFKRGFAFAKKAGDAASQAWALIGQGRAELAGKDFAAATAHLQEASALAAKLPDRTHLFSALNCLAEVQLASGDPMGAADLLGRAFSLAPDLKDQSPLLFAYLDRADIYRNLAFKWGDKKSFAMGLKDLDLAKADYEASLAIARKLDYAGLVRMIDEFLSEIQTHRKLFESQQRVYSAAARSRIFSPKKPGDVLVTEHFGSEKESDPAVLDIVKTFNESADKQLQESGIHEVAQGVRGAFRRGIWHAIKGESDAALADYLKAIELLEADRRNLRDEKSRSTFFEDKIAFYYPAISELLERRRFAEAFELMERSRSRAMADLLSSKKLALPRPEEQVLYGETQRLRAEIGQLQTTLFKDRASADREGFASRIKSAEKQIEQLEKQESAVAAQMAQKAPRLRELTVSEPVSLDRVQEMLRRDGCDMLYYLALDNMVILWHIGGDSVHVRNVFLPRSELQAKVNALRNSVASWDAKADEMMARELFLFLIQPALGWVKSHQLVLIPHAEMNYLPFAALMDPSGKSLGETFALSDAPSAGVLLDLKKGDAIAKGRLLAAADPAIEEARGEVEAVAACYPSHSKMVVEPLITESEVKSSAGDYDLLHFSVHGEFTRPDQPEPMLSCLHFAPDAHNDGRLTAAEMFGLPLGKAKLVVLSACETGQTEATRGNEILGMERALLYAGANNLVLSSWKVDATSAALWMKTFYREAQQKPLAEAARLALVEVKSKYPEPYHWAAFRLVGK
jgi:CHAT domain-containing protein/tetratricopeptide (TPR) repeat protein